MACAISTAPRVGVDLNSRCSRKCAAPATVAPSSRDPTPTQTPTDAERTAGRYSVTTLRPPGSVVRRTVRAAVGSAAGRRGICWRGGRSLRACFVLFGHQDQGDLAPFVDIGDLDPQLVADVDDVLDLRDALALAELGDVHQAVTPGQQRHERAEIRCLTHGSEESFAHRRQLRVTKSLVPADLKSISPNASSAPRMSVRVTKRRSVPPPSTSMSSETRPIAMPATGAFSGTPALSSASVDAHTEPIDVEPLELSASDTWRMAYGNSSTLGSTGTRARSARAPCPSSRRLGEPT